jgi:ribonuclease Z
MAMAFVPQLVNDPLGDPALYVGLPWKRRGLLLDLGGLESLSAANILKVTEAFVSHTHVDHFIGFDHLLRVVLGRDRRLRLYGPPGFRGQVAGKLAGYTWNMTHDYPLILEAAELHQDRLEVAQFVAAHGFARRDLPPEPARDGRLLEDPEFRVEAAILDHGVPVLAFALAERVHVNVNKDALDRMGLPPGPWITELKRAIRAEAPENTPIQVKWLVEGLIEERQFTVADLRERVVRVSRGQKLAYVTDAAYSTGNIERIVSLVGGADLFYCEAAYLERDRERAGARFHLTARQAGLLARRAGVRRLEVFHFSPMYRNEMDALLEEAQQAFRDG